MIFEWVLLFLAVAIGLYCERYFPEEFKSYMDVRDGLQFSVFEYLSIIFIIFWIIASVRLYLFSIHSRKKYFVIYIVGIFIYVFYGLYMESEWKPAFIETSQLTKGLFIALMYFFSIRESFELKW